MHGLGQPNVPDRGASPALAPPRSSNVAASRPTLRLRTVRVYQICEAITELLIYCMVLFSPWAFGTTKPWSIRTMSVAGYALGAMLLVKLFIRWFKGYRSPRWGAAHAEPQTGDEGRAFGWTRFVTVALATLTVLIVGFCLISALNARSTYRPDLAGLEYHKYVPWLPHSYDSNRSWLAFWNYLALALSFWAVRDWLLGKSAGEERAARMKKAESEPRPAFLLPTRMRRLLWVLSVNGALLALVGIVHRLSGSEKLLWLVKPRIPAGAFGPYNYQANAAQFFNLVWPVCLAFWWTLRRGARRRLHRHGRFSPQPHHLLLVCVMVMAVCPIISNSRGGAIIGAANIAIATTILLLARRRREGLIKLGVFLFFVATLLAALCFGWRQLGPRMEAIDQVFKSRESMYVTARAMAKDCPLFGTGPGTFEPLFQLYRSSPGEYWPAQLHNDWLETRITFGGLGSALLVLALLAILVRWLAPGGIHGGWRFTSLLWIALAGCLVHARFDFPFQIHSLLFLFLLICAILCTLSRRP